jgi:hypothetical protein
MAEKNLAEQCPSSHHVESNDTEKQQPHVVIPQERQSVIRRKVRHCSISVFVIFCLL